MGGGVQDRDRQVLDFVEELILGVSNESLTEGELSEISLHAAPQLVS